MKNAVRALLVAVLAVPALALAQIPSTADLKSQGDAAAAQATTTATDTAGKGVDQGVDKAAEKAGIK
jgi:hypothetical protein